jgi:CII-binding regulator of phage lambda lysogenization HflD
MSTNNIEAERYPFELCVEEKTIRQQKVITTTLGDLIAAVTDEVKPFVRDSSGLYMVVSYILNDVLARHRLRAHKRLLRKYPRNFAQERYSVSQSAC